MMYERVSTGKQQMFADRLDSMVNDNRQCHFNEIQYWMEMTGKERLYIICNDLSSYFQ